MHPFFACPQCKRVIINCICELTPDAASALAAQHPLLVRLRERIQAGADNDERLLKRWEFLRWLRERDRLPS